MNDFNSLIAHVTGGRRYCFVVMSYHDGYTFFETLRKVVAEVTGFECIRADDLPGAGADLRMKIHQAINNAVFVLGDVSKPRPNIYYELGYAVASNKPVLLIARDDADIHTDLQGLEKISYTDNKEGWQHFENALRKHLDIHKESNISFLRAMVLPPVPFPSFIVINPQHFHKDSPFKHHPKELKTYGDYLGLSGIMGAFASVYGESIIPEIVMGDYALEELTDFDANLFLIGSPKVNKFTESMLAEIQRGKYPNWRFTECPPVKGIKETEMMLTGNLKEGMFRTECQESKKNTYRDYGLLIRGPHPHKKGRSVMILAGPHSHGTGAACLAATKTSLIMEITKKLEGVADLTDRTQTIWVLVKGVTNKSRHLDINGVTIEDAGII